MLFSSQHSAVSVQKVMKDFRKLQVWGKSHQLALDIYKVSATFPKAEMYNLVSQIRVQRLQFQLILPRVADEEAMRT